MRFLWLLFAFICFSASAQAQLLKPELLGFSMGFGNENAFPFGSKDYDYSQLSVKIQFSKPIIERDKWNLDALVEPSIYFSEHQLLNPFFVREAVFGEDTERLREVFLQEKSFQEYYLGLGVRFRYKLFDNLQPYAFGAVSPGYSNVLTERLAKGFAFSDSFGFGVLVLRNHFYADLRGSIRHVSNANLQRPNNGHNSSALEMGLGYIF